MSYVFNVTQSGESSLDHSFIHNMLYAIPNTTLILISIHYGPVCNGSKYDTCYTRWLDITSLRTNIHDWHMRTYSIDTWVTYTKWSSHMGHVQWTCLHKTNTLSRYLYALTFIRSRSCLHQMLEAKHMLVFMHCQCLVLTIWWLRTFLETQL